jgi:hypothetical protein
MSAPAGLLLSGCCVCQCHTDETSETSPPVGRAAGERGALAVDRTSAWHAALACATCRDHHCPALSGRPPELARHFRVLPMVQPADAAVDPTAQAPATGGAPDAAGGPR